MALSFFVAPLRCAHCGAEHPDTIETKMQNQLGDKPWTEYRVGDAVPSTQSDLEDAFLRTGAPGSGEVRILQDWICPACGSRQWAEVIIADGRVQDIHTVELTREVVQRVHYVSDEIAEIYSELVGPLFDGLNYDRDFAQKLAAKLPKE